MNKTFLLLVASALALPSIAQHKNAYNNTKPWLIEVSAGTGITEQQLSKFDLNSIYPQTVNSEVSMLSFTDGKTLNFNGKLGYLFGKEHHWGIALGVMYSAGSGNLSMNSFHVEYKAVDFKNDVFRQVITATQPIKEEQAFSSISIPLTGMYQTRFGKKWLFAVDAGLVYNLQNQYSYSSSSTFDYEAIYKFQQSGSGITAVYDESPVPGKQNWLITKEHFIANNPDGDINSYFEGQAAKGYTVGIGKSASSSGDFSYKTGSIGFILQPSIGFMLNDRLALNLGLYYTYQKFRNEENDSFPFIDNKGNLKTMLGITEMNASLSYGGSLGLRFYFGK